MREAGAGYAYLAGAGCEDGLKYGTGYGDGNHLVGVNYGQWNHGNIHRRNTDD